jgi:hypothetical protein
MEDTEISPSQDYSLSVVCIGKESNRILRALHRTQAACHTATNGYILSSGSLKSLRKAYLWESFTPLSS